MKRFCTELSRVEHAVGGSGKRRKTISFAEPLPLPEPSMSVTSVRPSLAERWREAVPDAIVGEAAHSWDMRGHPWAAAQSALGATPAGSLVGKLAACEDGLLDARTCSDAEATASTGAHVRAPADDTYMPTQRCASGCHGGAEHSTGAAAVEHSSSTTHGAAEEQWAEQPTRDKAVIEPVVLAATSAGSLASGDVIIVPVACRSDGLITLVAAREDGIWTVNRSAGSRVEAKKMALEGMASAFPHLLVEMALACSWGDAHAIVVLVSEPIDQLDAEVEPAALARRRSELAGGGQIWVAQAALSDYSDAATLHIAGLLRIAQLQAPREVPTRTRFCTGASDAAYLTKSSEGTGVKV